MEHVCNHKTACNTSLNGRVGTFYVFNDPALFKGLIQLCAGRTAVTDKASTDLSGIKTASKPSPAKAKPAAKKKTAAKKKATAKPKATEKKKAKAAVKSKLKKPVKKKA